MHSAHGPHAGSVRYRGLVRPWRKVCCHSIAAESWQHVTSSGRLRRPVFLCEGGHKRQRSPRSAKSVGSLYERWPRDHFSYCPHRKTTTPKPPSTKSPWAMLSGERRGETARSRGRGGALVEDALGGLSAHGDSADARTIADSRSLQNWSGRPVRECQCRDKQEHRDRRRYNKCWSWWQQCLPFLLLEECWSRWT